MRAALMQRLRWRPHSPAAAPSAALASAFNHRPRKRFGQNFLTDDGVIAAIIAAIHPARGENLVEIGPGLAALTRPLLAAAGHMHAVEIDRDLAAGLRAQFGENLSLHVADVLDFDFAALGNGLRVVGNLPYNISTPLLFRLAQYADHIRDIHVMLQSEVVDRMVARASDSEYSRLSVMLQYRFALEKLIDVRADAFEPVPAVASAVVRLTPLPSSRRRARDDTLFARIVTAAFSQRRKTVRNSLGKFLVAEEFALLAIPATARAQNLCVAQFIAIADHVASRGDVAD